MPFGKQHRKRLKDRGYSEREIRRMESALDDDDDDQEDDDDDGGDDSQVIVVRGKRAEGLLAKLFGGDDAGGKSKRKSKDDDDDGDGDGDDDEGPPPGHRYFR